MKHSTVARIELNDAQPPPRFFARAKLSTDEAGHPYGQWSLAFELFSSPEEDAPLVFVQFVSDQAPTDVLRSGLQIQLYAGTRPIGTATVLLVPSINSPDVVDVDIFSRDTEPPRRKVA